MYKTLLFFLLLTLLPMAHANRYALVIGNSHYTGSAGVLKNPVNDAEDMAILLRKKQFTVTVLKDASKRQMKEGFDTFTRQLSQKDAVGLFFFAGHGIEVGGRNYLIPVNANIQGEADVEYEGIDAGRVIKGMEYAGNNLNMVILDACRNNPYARSFRSASRGLAKMSPSKGSLILYATSPGDVASDGSGRNGLFTQHLLEAIDTPNLTVEKVFKVTANKVYEETAKKQLPWQQGVMLGDFYFSGSTTVPDKPTNSSDGNQAEIIYWTSIQNEQNIAYFKSYLQQYPEGIYASLAHLKINLLSNKTPSVADLTLKASLEDSKVKILNIPPKYQAGIELKQKTHHAEASKSEYQQDTEWAELSDTKKVHPMALQQTAQVVIEPKFRAVAPSMVNIPKGCFKMGSPSEEVGRDNDEEQHQVCVETFQLAKKEVTRGEFRQFIQATKYKTQAENNVEKQGCFSYSSSENEWAYHSGYYWDSVGYNQNDQHPVICISWRDIQYYIDWFNQQGEGGYRLPTEAEWEYAARAGTQSRFFWSNEIDSTACFYGNVNDINWANEFTCDDGYEFTAPVGNYKANDFGLYDMTGNVREWTCSQYDKKGTGGEEKCTSNKHTIDSSALVSRGGSFGHVPRWLRVAYRFKSFPWVRNDAVGFRLARTN